MMKCSIKESILLSVLLFSLTSCGGVIGNIERYEFDVSKTRLDSLINKTFIYFPECKVRDTQLYEDDDETRFCQIDDDSKKLVFGFSTLPLTEVDSNRSEIVLTHAGLFGDVVQFNKNISFYNRYYFKKIFKNKFVSKVQDVNIKIND